MENDFVVYQNGRDFFLNNSMKKSGILCIGGKIENWCAVLREKFGNVYQKP